MTEGTTSQTRRAQASFGLLALIGLVLAFWALRALAPVAIAVVFAVFLAFVLRPVDRRVAEALPRRLAWLGRAAVMAVLLAVLALFIGGLVYAAQRVMGAMPAITDTLDRVLPAGMLEQDGSDGAETDGAAEATDGGGVFDLPGSLELAGGAFGGWVTDVAMNLAQTVANMTGTFVAFVVLVLFLVLLALGEADTWTSKIETLSRRHDRTKWHEAAALIATRLRRFLLIRAAMGVLSAVLYVGWLWIFGIDLLFVWAILTFILTFIPNIGSVISGLLPVLYAFLTADLGTAFAVGAGIFAIEQIIGNFIDPKLQGRQIVLSPLVILVAILFWSWLWGIAGAFLAVPMTSTILVVCAYVPALRPVALLLSNQRNEEELDEALAD